MLVIPVTGWFNRRTMVAEWTVEGTHVLRGASMSIAPADRTVASMEKARELQCLAGLKRLRAAAQVLELGQGVERAAAASGLEAAGVEALVAEIEKDPSYLGESIAEHVMRASVGDLARAGLGTELLRNLYNDREFPALADAVSRGA